MPRQNNHLVSNLCFGCVAGIYFGIVLFAIVVSLFFQSSFSGIEVLNGYAVAMLIGGFTGLVSTYFLHKLKGK